MNLAMICDMVADGMGDRVLLGGRSGGLTGGRLRARATAGAAFVASAGADRLVYLGGNGPAFPVALFAAALAGVPFLPLNYRLSAEQLGDVMSRQKSPLVVTDTPERVPGARTVGLEEFCALPAAQAAPRSAYDIDAEEIAVLLMTSGTTAAPKSAVLRHRHLVSYLFGSVEFGSADETDATLVSVPPYHIAAVANALSNLYSGRRVVYLDHFTAADWLDTVEREHVTHAMVVPTMLVRIVAELKARGRRTPAHLRSLSYGGAKVSGEVIAEALRLFPDTGFVNAYGLTETASSIAVLGPEDHREALASPDPAVRARLGSVGRALPSVEIEVHDPEGRPCPPGVVGDIVVRGDQVAGEYVESGSRVREDGWFPTRDRGHLDSDGFLFVQGRADDTIIRGGENIAPAEIEDVLARHEAVLECAVAGVPDLEWGQRIAAFVVPRPGRRPEPEELREWVRERLRSAKTPDDVVILEELPTTPTGKILRRELVDMVSTARRDAARR
ncbi:class I adenylate-forming enzyme family protein [Thermomonospora cellulosilytica]|uniref:Acyl-CoA synthetase (AMP-forming)/AMP-acid ligase II n=1 Tax=Thermomonospora cellulosilytica TaxID=1411118 RepID=A0A7W3R9J4_9ACTN|nr:fatty acid--CoA ligase family protein [Thermomonospora cellulosilytica]MBA9005428.1 acyl-CoA synthetase (AMP-forming)/AMP-acid ligase II [Thermomonospora cellulosilytica]